MKLGLPEGLERLVDLRPSFIGILDMRTVYFDYNASTPLDPQVCQAMLPLLGEIHGNPSSVHHVGRQARNLLDQARERVAMVWRCKASEVVFTSGGTESVNLAILGTARLLRDRGRHLITSSIEHHAVLHAYDYLERKEGFQISRLPVTAEGIIDPETLAKAIRPDTVLVSLMAANNETGSVQPVAELGRICREGGVLFHTDAVQWLGKEPFESIHQFNADLVSACAHKIHGPKGVGALFVRSPLHPDPILFGGSHENERRAGTENLACIVGLAEAMDRFVGTPVFDRAHLLPLTGRLIALVDSLAEHGVLLRSPRTRRLVNTVAFTVQGCDSISLLANLDLEGICASSGSACTAGSLQPSHVIQALGVQTETAHALVRFSLGRESTAAEVDLAETVLPRIIQRVQQPQ